MDVIIIGAGAAGLMAAKQLSAAGLKVCLLEARKRPGGRIHAFSEKDDDQSFEGGAEFIHGNLEITLELLKEAGLEKQELEGGVWQVIDGKWQMENDFFAYSELVIEKLKELDEDVSMANFIDRYFSGEKYEGLRISLTSYVEGYYSGEVSKTSAKSFLEEWLSEDDQQYRPADGYGKMIDYLVNHSRKDGAIVQFSTVVKEIKWSGGRVEVVDETGHIYKARKAIITVPLGVWTAGEKEPAVIRYTPALPVKIEAAKQMGFGSVIKVLLKFKEAFWEDETAGKKCNADTTNFQMAISDMPVPTWWTQLPRRSSLLTGWLSGPTAEQMKNDSDAIILINALDSLSTIFHTDIFFLKEQLQWSKVFNWTHDPFTRGSYSYSTLQTAQARSILMQPEEDTLFFAGEALYEGPEMGTVEAALTSGMQVAGRIVAEWKGE